MEQTLLDPGLTNKIYSVRSIRIATFIGGPLVAAYLMAANFKQFGEEHKVTRTWLWSILIFIALIIISFFLPDSIPNIVYNLVYLLIASFFVQKYQAEKIDSHINSGGLTYKTYRAVLIAIVSMIIMVAILLGCYAISDLAGLYN
jgi:predicted neutral ceramidase superfamily lipid hydrolase